MMRRRFLSSVLGQSYFDSSTQIKLIRHQVTGEIVMIRRRHTSQRTKKDRHHPQTPKSHEDSGHQGEEIECQNTEADSPVKSPLNVYTCANLSTASTLVPRSNLLSGEDQQPQADSSEQQVIEHSRSPAMTIDRQDIRANLTTTPLDPLATFPSPSELKRISSSVEFEETEYLPGASRVANLCPKGQVSRSMSKARSFTTSSSAGDCLFTSPLVKDKDGHPPDIVPFTHADGEYDLRDYSSMMSAIGELDTNGALLDDIAVAEIDQYPNSWMPDILKYLYPEQNRCFHSRATIDRVRNFLHCIPPQEESGANIMASRRRLVSAYKCLCEEKRGIPLNRQEMQRKSQYVKGVTLQKQANWEEE